MLRSTVLTLAILALVGESLCEFRIIRPTYRPPRRGRPVIRTARDVEFANLENDGELKEISEIETSNDDAVLRVVRSMIQNEESEDLPLSDAEESDPETRHRRSLDSPSAKRGGGSHSTSSGSRNTGATHPGYNRRNARNVPDLKWIDAREPLWLDKNRNPHDTHLPKYIDDIRLDPNRRYARDLRTQSAEPFWRPVPPKPDHPQGSRVPLSRIARDLQIAGMKKPSQRDIIIPNWNPHAKNKPWQRIG